MMVIMGWSRFFRSYQGIVNVALPREITGRKKEANSLVGKAVRK